jgi:hypothetical protein
MSIEAVWQEYAKFTNGELIPSSILRNGVDQRVISSIDPWKVALDTVTSYNPSVHTVTAMKLPFFNPTNLQFSLQKNDLAAKFKALFGKKPIPTGSADFDKKYSITGSDPEKIRQIFSDAAIQELVGRQPQITFEISRHQTPESFTGKLPAGVSMLCYYELSRKIKDVERLKTLFALVKTVITRMQTLGLVGDGTPDVEF